MKSKLLLVLVFLSYTLGISAIFYHKNDKNVKVINDNRISETNLTNDIVTNILANYRFRSNNITNDWLRKEPLTNFIIRRVFDYIFKLLKVRGTIDLPSIAHRQDNKHYLEAWEGEFWDLNLLNREEQTNMYNDRQAKTYTTIINLWMESGNVQYKYEAKHGILWASGYILAKLNMLSVRMEHIIHYGETTCFQSINDVLLYFNNIDIGVTGTGIFNKLVANVVEDYIKENKNRILYYLSQEIENLFEDKINDLVNCDKIKFIFEL